jgi:hypothetical protein
MFYWELEITEFESNQVLEIVSRCGDLLRHERDVFVPDGDNTRYTTSIETIGSPLKREALQRKTVHALVALKAVLEGGGKAAHVARRTKR